jgi:hypothetical protein
MSYVDLNPIRSGMAETLESSAHTRAVQRIETLRSDPATAKAPLSSLTISVTAACLPITSEDYLDLIDWTGRLTRADKHGSIGASEPPILRTLG